MLAGYLRPEANFDSLEALIEAIHLDIQVSRETLESVSVRTLPRKPCRLLIRPPCLALTPPDGSIFPSSHTDVGGLGGVHMDDAREIGAFE